MIKIIKIDLSLNSKMLYRINNNQKEDINNCKIEDLILEWKNAWHQLLGIRLEEFKSKNNKDKD